jgi:hypothetical protein
MGSSARTAEDHAPRSPPPAGAPQAVTISRTLLRDGLNPQAGYLLAASYIEWGEILYGDSITSLRALQRDIDLFINDSDHSAEYDFPWLGYFWAWVVASPRTRPR